MRFVYATTIAAFAAHSIDASFSAIADEIVTPGKPEEEIVIEIEEKQEAHSAQPSPSFSDEGRISAASPFDMDSTIPVIHQESMPWIVEVPSYSERDGPITVSTTHAYTGATVNGKPHGRGILAEITYPYTTMSGTFMDGLKHGEFHFRYPHESVHYGHADKPVCYIYDSPVMCESFRGVTVAPVADASVFMLESRYSDSDHSETFGEYFVEVECQYTGTVRFDTADAAPFVPHGFGTLVCGIESFTGVFLNGIRSGLFSHKYAGERVASPMEFPTVM